MLSREKRILSPDIFKDYYDKYDSANSENFFKSKQFRLYFSKEHFPTNKIKQTNFLKDKYYYPETYLNIKDIENLEGKWFVKPIDGSDGDGIIITDELVKFLDNPPDDVIYQKSVENILLDNNKKQDIRIFFVIQTYGGYFRTFVYKEAPVRLSYLDYDKLDFSKSVQLTNYSKYLGDSELALKKFTTHKNYNELYNNIKNVLLDMSVKIFEEMNGLSVHRNILHIIGVDFLPDNNKKVWLLETNNNPGPTCSTQLPKAFNNFTKKIVEDTINQLIKPMESQKEIVEKDFDVVFKKKLIFNKWIFV